MEFFSTPQSNKRTAGLPNSRPVDLQGCCSVLLGSLPLRLCQATAPDWSHSWQDPCLLGLTGSTHHLDSRPWAGLPSSHQTHTTRGYPSLSYAGGSMTTGIPMTCRRQTPARSQSHSYQGNPHPEPTALQALLSSSNHMGWLDPCPLDSRPSSPAGLQLHVEQLEPHHSGTGTSLALDIRIHQPARNSAPQVEMAPTLQAS
jgi:hypothetical protein